MTARCVYLLFLVCLAHGFQPPDAKPTTSAAVSSKITFQGQGPKRFNSESPSNKDKILSPIQTANESEDNGLVEVKESEIPEGSLVYVLEEPIDQPVDGEILKTADNIVFRPLFRYRGKQEAQRRNSHRIRRRYFIPKRSYRQTYSYPYYYNHRYY